MPHTNFTPEETLVALMLAVSASDETIRTAELVSIERMVNHLPAFADFEPDRLKVISNAVLDLFADEEGLDILWNSVRSNLPERLYETAYAMCCDVAAADGHAPEGELRFLEEMRYQLKIDRLHAAAIERGARALHLSI